MYHRAIIQNDDGTTGETIATADSYLNLETAARDEMAKRGIRRVRFETSDDGEVWEYLEQPRFAT